MLHPRRPSPECFDIAQELIHWRGRFHHPDIASLRLSEATLCTSFRFAYDSYILQGKHAFHLAVPAIQKRYERDLLRHKVTWQQMYPICRMVWERLHQDVEPMMQMAVGAH